MPVYTLHETKTGRYTLVASSGGREVRLHSAYDPESEAARSVDAHKTGRASVILVAGIGLGYHLHFLKKKHPDLPVLAIEKDMEVVNTARRLYPEHLAGAIIVTCEEDAERALDSFDMHSFRGISLFTHRPSYGLAVEFYDRLIDRVRQGISSRVSDLLTRFEFEKTWVENIFENLPSITDSHRIGSLFGRFKGYAGIIVSAGPSLKKNARLLSRFYDRALIVVVDTAVKPLQKSGSRAHLVMTLDAQKHSIKHFLGQKSYEPALVADMVSCPSILRDYRGEKILSTTARYFNMPDGTLHREATPVMGWLERFIPPPGDIQSGGSVATSAFDLLLSLGCDPIILTGQDLAYTGREIHCNGTHHNESWLPGTNRFINLETINQRVIRKRSIKYIPAFGGTETVLSDFVFDLYRSWFEDSCRVAPVRVINATEGGAHIKNTEEAELSSLLDTIPRHEKTPAEIIKSAFSKEPPVQVDTFRSALSGAVESLRLVQESCSSGQGNPEEIAANEGISELFIPYMRKTRLVIARKNPEAQEEDALIRREMLHAATELSEHMKRCLDRT